ncbi:hypothetical protein BT96DRAFT_1007757 [Gymnopus androsaceus JB14]|uniref:Uncharacterized protein n=1 Tax=Gymnopus androsaceus JB14 TaxID=1447944 RepID=A0A6A4GHJ4_9AGAR|nr:hypothetical protein BT96DRAFT_1007757 [Gymnopus androsaceus JB14]
MSLSLNSQVAMSRPSAISPRPVLTPPVVLPGGVPLTLSTPPPKAPTPPPSTSTPIPSPIPLPIPSPHSPMFSPLIGQSANPSNHWSPVPHWPPMPILHNNNVGSLQQELLDMQRHFNSAQLDPKTKRACNKMSVVQTQHLEAQIVDLHCLNSEQERMLKNHQVEYKLLQAEVKTLVDSAAASAASTAQAKAYKAFISKNGLCPGHLGWPDRLT